MLIYVIGLLVVIAACEITRIVMTYKKQSRLAHFKGKFDGVQKMIWDLEFKVFKTREIREDVRQEYDFMCSRHAAIEEKIKNWLKGENEGELARERDAKVIAERDRDRLLAQIKQLDVEIEGSKRTNEYPDGAEGIVQQIDSLRELKDMLRDYIKSIK